MTDPGPARQSHRPPRRRPHRKPGRRRVLRAVERAILGAGMTVVAFVVERRLLKALRQGGTTRKASIPEPGPGAQVTATAATDSPNGSESET